MDDEKRLAEIRETVRRGFGPRWAQGATKTELYDAAADLLRMFDAERAEVRRLREALRDADDLALHHTCDGCGLPRVQGPCSGNCDRDD